MEGKAMQGMSRAEEKRFCDLIEDLGGGPADGHGRLDAEALNADCQTFDRAAEMALGGEPPETAREKAALDRWRMGE